MKKTVKNITITISILAIIIPFLLSVSFFLNWYYNVPTEQSVEQRFNQKFPDYKFIEAYTGDGHSDWVVYYINYKKPNDERTYEAIWEYYREDKEWITYGGEGKPKD